MTARKRKTIAVLGTLDSKGPEHAFVADRIRENGCDTVLIDIGTLGEPQVSPDISREEMLGGNSLPEKEDRGLRVDAMARSAPEQLRRLAGEGKIDGVISLGGGGGTAIATAAMRALPIGFPKLMVSTLASGNTAHYVGEKDIVMFPSIVDVAGLNRISKTIFNRAAGAICGMVQAGPDDTSAGGNPLLVASMFGNTTDCVNDASGIFEEAGYEVLVFHATGTGGRTMESIIESGMVTGVFDVTTTEWADELLGGVLAAGPGRLEAAGTAGLPAIVAPGCLDMVNFGEPATVPPEFEGRTLYHHNPQVTLMRTNAKECAELGRILAEKVNGYTGPVTVALPLRGVSVISRKGGPFHDPEADTALFDSIREHLADHIPLLEINAAINDAEFSSTAANTLLEMIG